MAQQLERVDVQQVAALVREGAPGTAIVDVRSTEEFAAAHVKGALNLDSSRFGDTAAVDALVEQLAPSSTVVVHCAKSLERGPTSAAALKQRLAELGIIDKQVIVMDGGFNKYSEVFGDDSSVVAGGGAAATANGGGGCSNGACH